ncbi:hypothetical protein EXIGLDRAFT_762827 [Exidia glandulosa HHB12029]|uniref:Uncharacterized protein n=1 Tax=Exidia glandulosa HHB12029 TaxID=1314781 RepID=A0A165MI68_EXIGL|nr:hypothetical protein EXIGLDRAFT_762827 [Exidia glandulosa HHB12029]
MKFSLALSTLAVLLAAVIVEAAPQQGSAIPRLQPAKVTPKKAASPPTNNAATLKPFGSNGAAVPNKGAAKAAKGNQAKGGKGKNGAGNAGASTAAAATTTAAADAATATTAADASATTDVADAAASQAAGASADDLQTSLTLDPGQVQPGLAQDGQAVPTAGQISSLTSTNNFINYCATRPDLPLTNGQQILTGSCNPTIMGEIIAKDKMPSAKIISPPNFSTIAKGSSVTFKIKTRNMDTGHFVNAQLNYFAAPQQGNAQGILIAHSHITVNAISSFQDSDALDPQLFTFFKGLNDPAVNDILSADAPGGFDVGFYRACTINSAANHQPALVAVAQHASLDDCTYFQVTESGADDTGAGAGADAGAAATAAATDSASAAATTTAAGAAQTAAAGNNGKGKNNNGKGGNKAVLSPKGSNGAQVNVKTNKPTFSPPARTAASKGNGRNRRFALSRSA